jgi:hypothetical protein
VTGKPKILTAGIAVTLRPALGNEVPVEILAIAGRRDRRHRDTRQTACHRVAVTVVSVSTVSGSIRVVCEPRADVSVEGGEQRAKVKEEPGTTGRLTIHPRHPSMSVTVHCPEGVDVYCATVSSSVSVHGRAGYVGATSVSGAIVIERAGGVDARSTSGRIEVGRCDGMCRLHAVSGRAKVGRAGRADLASMTGRVTADEVGDTRARTASGSVRIGLTAGASADVKTRSGAVEIYVPRATRPRLVLRRRTGRCESDVDEGEDGSIVVESTSGHVSVRYR